MTDHSSELGSFFGCEITDMHGSFIAERVFGFSKGHQPQGARFIGQAKL